MAATIKIPIKLRYGEGDYGEFPYKNEWRYIELPIPIPVPDKEDDEEWLIDQYREDFLN